MLIRRLIAPRNPRSAIDRRRSLSDAAIIVATMRVVAALVVAASSVAASAAVGASALNRQSTTGLPSFASETAYLRRLPPTHPKHVVRVSSAAAFARTVAAARAGQTIVVGRRVVIPGEFTGFNRVVEGGVVNVVFQRGATFVGGQGFNIPAVFVQSSGGWRIWGGTIINPTGSGLLIHATQGPFTWTGFRVHKTAGSCVSVLPGEGNVNGVVLEGVTGTAIPSLAQDNHPEKGTGIHAWNIADANGGVVQNSVFAADIVEQATGAAVQIDTGQIGANVTVYARARHLGFPIAGSSWDGDAKMQVAGNVIQLWGSTPKGNLDVKYAEGNDIQGRIVDTTGVDDGANLSRVSLEFGRISGPILQNPALSRTPYQVKGGLRLMWLEQPLSRHRRRH